jgi:pimeloyl-ACP methyl ester carboxylesterase
MPREEDAMKTPAAPLAAPPFAAALFAALVFAAGCGGSPAATVRTTPRPTPPAALDGCVRPGEARLTKNGFTTAVVLGQGTRGVVFSNQSNENLCAWLPEAHKLVALGYRVALYDYAANATGDDLNAVVTVLRRQGARSIVLAGASQGAKTSMVVATTIKPPVDGVVALSAEATSQEYGPMKPYAARLRVPTLYVTSTNDPDDNPPSGPAFARTQPDHRAKLLLVTTAAHGTALLTPQVQQAIVTFLSAHTA